MESKLRPARATKPGDILRGELEARGWTQKDFAAIVGRPPQAISEIVQGRKSITPDTAVLFSQAFGTSAEMWLNLENAFRLRLAENRLRDTGVAERAARFAADRRLGAKKRRADRRFQIAVEPHGTRFVARCAELRLQAAGGTAEEALNNLATLMYERLPPEVSQAPVHQ